MHSAVEYTDNSVIAQMSVPDMRLCVQYALTHPERTKSVIPELDLTKIGTLSFAKPDTETFPLLPLAIHAIETGGALPAVLNAANEIAVAAFLKEKLSFTGIFDLVGETVSVLETEAKAQDSLDGIFAMDEKARATATRYLNCF